MGRKCEVRYNPRSNRWEIPFKKRDLGYFKRLTKEEALSAFEEEHGFPCPSQKPSKPSKKKTAPEVLVETNEEQEDANESDLEPSEEDN